MMESMFVVDGDRRSLGVKTSIECIRQGNVLDSASTGVYQSRGAGGHGHNLIGRAAQGSGLLMAWGTMSNVIAHTSSDSNNNKDDDACYPNPACETMGTVLCFSEPQAGMDSERMAMKMWEKLPGLLRRGFAVLLLYDHTEAAPEVVAFLAMAGEKGVFDVAMDDGFGRARDCGLREGDVWLGTSKDM